MNIGDKLYYIDKNTFDVSLAIVLNFNDSSVLLGLPERKCVFISCSEIGIKLFYTIDEALAFHFPPVYTPKEKNDYLEDEPFSSFPLPTSPAPRMGGHRFSYKSWK